VNRNSKWLTLVLFWAFIIFPAHAQVFDYQIIPEPLTIEFEQGVKELKNKNVKEGFSGLDRALVLLWRYQIQDLPAYSWALIRLSENFEPNSEPFSRLLEYSNHFSPHLSEPAFARAKLFLSAKHFSLSKALSELNTGFKLLGFDLISRIRLKASLWLGLYLFICLLLIAFSLVMTLRNFRLFYHWLTHLLTENFQKLALPLMLLIAFLPVFLHAPFWIIFVWPGLLCLSFASQPMRMVFIGLLFLSGLGAFLEPKGRGLIGNLTEHEALSYFRVGLGLVKYEDLDQLRVAVPGAGSKGLLLALAEAERRDGNIERSVQILKELASEQALIEAYNQLGGIYLDSGETREAITVLERATRLNPIYPELYYNLSQAYELAKKFDQSDLAYRKATELDRKAVVRFDYLKRLSGISAITVRIPIPAVYLEEGIGNKAVWSDIFKPGIYHFIMALLGLIIAIFIAPRNELRICFYCGQIICGKCLLESPAVGVCAPCYQVFRLGKGLSPELKAKQRHLVQTYHRLTGGLGLALNIFLPGFGLLLEEKIISGILMIIFPLVFWAGFFSEKLMPAGLTGGLGILPGWLLIGGIIYLIMIVSSELLYVKLAEVRV